MEKNKELRSLNTELPTLYAEVLEQRLETDPLAVGGLIGGDSNVRVENHVESTGCDSQSCNGINFFV